MKKILVTDLMGTLIPSDYLIANYLYGDGTCDGYYNDLKNNSEIESKNWDKAFIHTGKFLKEFLQKGNQVHIVTSIEGHTTLKEMYEILIKRIYDFWYQSSYDLRIYLKSDNLENLLEEIRNWSIIRRGTTFLEVLTPVGQKILFLNKKEEVFNHFQINGALLYAIGDTYKDLDMLLKAQSFGGKTDFINQNLSFFDLSLKEIITKILGKEERQIIIKILLERFPNFYQLDFKQQHELFCQIQKEVITPDFIYDRRISLYKNAFNGEIDMDRELKEICIYDILDLYSLLYKKNISANLYSSFDIYPTFSSYYERVLKR